MGLNNERDCTWMCPCLNKVTYFVWLVNWLFSVIRMGTYDAFNRVIIFETSVWTSKLFAGKERIHLDQELHRPRTNSFICFVQYPSSSSSEDHHWFLLYKPVFFTSLLTVAYFSNLCSVSSAFVPIFGCTVLSNLYWKTACQALGNRPRFRY